MEAKCQVKLLPAAFLHHVYLRPVGIGQPHGHDISGLIHPYLEFTTGGHAIEQRHRRLARGGMDQNASECFCTRWLDDGDDRPGGVGAPIGKADNRTVTNRLGSQRFQIGQSLVRLLPGRALHRPATGVRIVVCLGFIAVVPSARVPHALKQRGQETIDEMAVAADGLLSNRRQDETRRFEPRHHVLRGSRVLLENFLQIRITDVDDTMQRSIGTRTIQLVSLYGGFDVDSVITGDRDQRVGAMDNRLSQCPWIIPATDQHNCARATAMAQVMILFVGFNHDNAFALPTQLLDKSRTLPSQSANDDMTAEQTQPDSLGLKRKDHHDGLHDCICRSHGCKKSCEI